MLTYVVDGIAIIDDTYDGPLEALPPVRQVDLKSESAAAAASSYQLPKELQLLSPYTSEDDDAGKQTGSQASHKRVSNDVLKTGGYVIFTKDFVRAHPTSPIACAAPIGDSVDEVDALHPFPRTAEPAQTESSTGGRTASDKMRANAKIVSYIDQAEEEQWPLFRRANSSLIYGSGVYESSQ